MRRVGFEPTTYRLWGGRSNHWTNGTCRAAAAALVLYYFIHIASIIIPPVLSFSSHCKSSPLIAYGRSKGIVTCPSSIVIQVSYIALIAAYCHSSTSFSLSLRNFTTSLAAFMQLCIHLILFSAQLTIITCLPSAFAFSNSARCFAPFSSCSYIYSAK